MGAAAVHLDLPSAGGTFEFMLAIAFIGLTVLAFGPSALIVLLELAQLVVGRHHPADGQRSLVQRVLEHPQGLRRLTRFTPAQRVQHWLLTVLFILLCLTGFPMKFADQGWAATTIALFGGLAIARHVHHWAGVALMAGFAVHLALVGRNLLRSAATVGPDGRRMGLRGALLALPLMVNLDDARRALRLLRYLVGLERVRPTFGRFSVNEKFEYLGVLWGTTLLSLTGLMLWGEQIISHFLGGRAFNFALIIHTYEAFLALIHVGILHMYNVLLAPSVFPISPATLSGATPVAKLAEEHGEFVRDAARTLGLPVEGDHA
jgi:cytochrome b subunit of formate dehydrogenase